jgi:hypothetical protein
VFPRNIRRRGDDPGVQRRRDEGVLGSDARCGRHDRRIQSGSGSRFVRRDTRSWRHDGIEGESAAGLIATYVDRCGSDHVGGKTGSSERRVQAFRRRWAGVGLEGEQVGDRVGGRRKFKVRSVDDVRCQRAAASHVNGLGPVMRFPAAGTACGASPGTA